MELTAEVEADIERASAQAPEHNPVTLLGISITRKLFPGCRQVAVFDSVFHATMPDAACTYAAPIAWKEIWGLRRLGFHGLSHRYCSQRGAELLGRDVGATALVTCHLGNGCSLAAVKGGRSIDTTMGWTPNEGVTMGQRSGDIDSGILLHLLARGRYGVAELQRVLNEESGLRGLSGLSGDMRETIAAAQQGHPRPRLALAVYVHRLRKAIAAMIAVLGRIDALTFTGGVGENAPSVREAACSDFGWCGIRIDSERNKAPLPDANISAPKAKVPVFVIKSEEAWQMARECYALEGRNVS
jgi:acetate kinase